MSVVYGPCSVSVTMVLMVRERERVCVLNESFRERERINVCVEKCS